MFRLPDYRECVLVGTGQSTRAEIAEHDVYTLGEYKDDQLQGHKHDDSGHTHTIPMRNDDNGEGGVPTKRNNSIYTQPTTNTGYANLGLPVKYDDTNGTPRIGATTHGKQIGINYIIKY